MKEFIRDGKYNFVDDNNVFVGFDSTQDCCEHFGWSLDYERKIDSIPGINNGINPDGYQFDISFYEKGHVHPEDENPMFVAFFRLKKPGFQDIYLSLWNQHNGYYAHGFNFCSGDTIIKSGIL